MRPIENVCIKEIRTVRSYHSAYKVRNDKPMVWLQKICCWILGKIGALHFEEDVKYTIHGICADTFMERIFRSERCVHQFTGKQGEVLLIGAEDYQHLMMSQEIRSSFSFNANYQYQNSRDGIKLCGLKVCVLPYLRGIVVLPSGIL